MASVEASLWWNRVADLSPCIDEMEVYTSGKRPGRNDRMQTRLTGHAFVAVEGLSGTGKSTVARALSAALTAVLYATPPAPFASIRNEVDKLCGLTERYFFYLAGVVFASSQICELLRSRPVVCDRYIFTTQCYHRAGGVKSIVPTERLAIIEPDLTVLITCGEDERRRRLVQRGLSYNDQEEQRLGIEQSMLQEYRSCGLFEIDSTARSPESIAEQILAHLGRISTR